MEYLIRRCQEKDLPALVELCEKHAAYEKTAYNANGKQELLANAIFGESQKLFSLVVESNNLIAGYATYTFDFSTWDAKPFLHLDCLYLEPGFRGYGIGEAIIKKLMAIATQHGCVTIQWQTPTFNKRAIKFYNRMGASGKHKVRFSLGLP